MNQIRIDNISSCLSGFFEKSNYTQVAVLADEHTQKDCYPIIAQLLPEHLLIEIRAGEQYKILSTCEVIWQTMTDATFDRKALLVNLGGGVIGDMGGFCAATYKRGIDFINLPTTLLAAVDANVGGKLGIDFQGLKNHLGIFRDPKAVFIDPVFLNTLTERELRSGFAEVIKHGLIADKDYFSQLAKTGLKQRNWRTVIARSVEIKRSVVAKDPQENGLRKILNFGHSIGHAIESYYLNTANHLLHGEAIVIGMICEAYLSKKILGMTSTELNNICDTLLQIYPDLKIDQNDFTAIIKLMYQDKKNVDGFLNHSLLYAIGHATYDISVIEKDVMEALSFYLKLKK